MAKAACAICAYPADKQCARCKQVSYCSKEHQRMAWPKHKTANSTRIPTNHLQKPIVDFAEIPKILPKTECCQQSICNGGDENSLSAWASTSSCRSNHNKETLCALHHRESHGPGKWQDCENCKAKFPEKRDYASKGTNTFNFKSDIWENAPVLDEATRCMHCQRTIDADREMYIKTEDGRFKCLNCSQTSVPLSFLPSGAAARTGPWTMTGPSGGQLS